MDARYVLDGISILKTIDGIIKLNYAAESLRLQLICYVIERYGTRQRRFERSVAQVISLRPGSQPPAAS